VSVKKQLRIQPFIFLAGSILTLAELFVRLNSSSLCHSEGCGVVNSFARSELLLVAAGFLFFVVLTVLSLFRSSRYGEPAIDFFLILASVVEGYFLGFQAFVVKTFCYFCLVVAAFIFAALLYRLIALKRLNLVAGLFSSLAIFTAVWFVNPFIGVLPEAEYVLIYSKDCPHCHKVLEFCKEKGIDVVTVEVSEIRGLCRSLGVRSVPALIRNAPDRKEIVIGETQIVKRLSEVLASRAKDNLTSTQVATEVKVKKVSEKKEVKSQSGLVKGEKNGVSADLLDPLKEEDSGGTCFIDFQTQKDNCR